MATTVLVFKIHNQMIDRNIKVAVNAVENQVMENLINSQIDKIFDEHSNLIVDVVFKNCNRI